MSSMVGPTRGDTEGGVELEAEGTAGPGTIVELFGIVGGAEPEEAARFDSTTVGPLTCLPACSEELFGIAGGAEPEEPAGFDSTTVGPWTSLRAFLCEGWLSSSTTMGCLEESGPLAMTLRSALVKFTKSCAWKRHVAMTSMTFPPSPLEVGNLGPCTPH